MLKDCIQTLLKTKEICDFIKTLLIGSALKPQTIHKESINESYPAFSNNRENVKKIEMILTEEILQIKFIQQ